jgi:uncharacterized membrane protein HdeD (DUF308 family)
MATAEMAGERTGGLSSNEWWIALLEGIAAIIIGILLITDPGTTLVTLMVFLGVWWFVGGIFDLVRLFVDRTQWGWKLFSGILGIIAGLAIVRHPLWASFLVPATLVWVLGFLGIVIGIMSLVSAFQGAGWGSGILGAISIGLGLLLISSNLFLSVAVIVPVAAIWAIVGGVIAIVYAFRLRSAAA